MNDWLLGNPKLVDRCYGSIFQLPEPYMRLWTTEVHCRIGVHPRRVVRLGTPGFKILNRKSTVKTRTGPGHPLTWRDFPLRGRSIRSGVQLTFTESGIPVLSLSDLHNWYSDNTITSVPLREDGDFSPPFSPVLK